MKSGGEWISSLAIESAASTHEQVCGMFYLRRSQAAGSFAVLQWGTACTPSSCHHRLRACVAQRLLPDVLAQHRIQLKHAPSCCH